MNNDDEMKKIIEEEQKKFNMWEASQRQESIEKYGKDIYKDKEIGMEKMRKVNNAIDIIIRVIRLLVIVAIVALLIFFLIMGWGSVYKTYVK